MLNHAAWGKANIICVGWAKKSSEMKCGETKLLQRENNLEFCPFHFWIGIKSLVAFFTFIFTASLSNSGNEPFHFSAATTARTKLVRISLKSIRLFGHGGGLADAWSRGGGFDPVPCPVFLFFATFLNRALISEVPDGAARIFSYLLCCSGFQTHGRVAPDCDLWKTLYRLSYRLRTFHSNGGGGLVVTLVVSRSRFRILRPLFSQQPAVRIVCVSFKFRSFEQKSLRPIHSNWPPEPFQANLGPDETKKSVTASKT